MSSKYSGFYDLFDLLDSTNKYYKRLFNLNTDTHTVTRRFKTKEKIENLQEFAEYVQRKLNLNDIRSTENDIIFIECIDGTPHIYEIIIRIVYEEEHIRFVCTFYNDDDVVSIGSDSESDEEED
jgi:hypothetical protein